MAIKREWTTQGASEIRASKIRGRRTNLLLLVHGRSKGLLLHMVFKDRVVAIRAKASINHLKMGGISGLLASQSRGNVSIATRAETRLSLEVGIPKLWDTLVTVISRTCTYSVCFSLPPPWARGTSISPMSLHSPMLLHNQVGWARVWVRSRPGLISWDFRGPRACLHYHILDRAYRSVGQSGYIFTLSLMGKSVV